MSTDETTQNGRLKREQLDSLIQDCRLRVESIVRLLVECASSHSSFYLLRFFFLFDSQTPARGSYYNTVALSVKESPQQASFFFFCKANEL